MRFAFLGPMDGMPVDDSAAALAAGEDPSAYAQRVQVLGVRAISFILFDASPLAAEDHGARDAVARCRLELGSSAIVGHPSPFQQRRTLKCAAYV